MTEKKRNLYDWVWRTMREHQFSGDVWHTAGQVGKMLGISRNTAKKYLDELITTGTVVRKEVTGSNWQTWSIYQAILPDTQ